MTTLAAPVTAEPEPVFFIADGDHGTAAEEEFACRAFSRADEDAMITACYPLVRPTAWKILVRLPHGGIDIDELVSLGATGLVLAARRFGAYCIEKRFDPFEGNGSYQRAFALRRINGAILDHLRTLDHVSRGDRKRAKALADGLTPGQLGITEQQAATALAADARRPVSLDDTRSVDGTTSVSVSDMVGDPDPSPESQAVAASIRAAALAAFDGLDALSRVVVAFVFVKELTPAQAAEAMQPGIVLTEAEVARIRDEAACRVHSAMLRAAAG